MYEFPTETILLRDHIYCHVMLQCPYNSTCYVERDGNMNMNTDLLRLSCLFLDIVLSFT
jgi:hypothetical protein